MINIYISLLSRVLSVFPLIVLFMAIFKTYWEKLNSINGLRRTRLVLLLLILALLVDQLVFIYCSIASLVDQLDHIRISTAFLLFDKLLVTASLYCLYYLFRHAVKKHE